MIIQIKQKIQNEELMPFFLAAIIFSIPLSPSLKSIFVAATTALIFFMPAYRYRLNYIITQQCTVAALAIVLVAIAACFWSAASYQQQFFSLEKYLKILYIPLLAVGFSNKRTRTMGIHVFLLASLIVCTFSMLKNWNLFHYKSSDPGEVFYNHIVTGYMMAFAAYLSALYVTRTERLKQFFYLLLAILFSYQVLFVNTGRTGYVVYFILLALLLCKCMSSRKRIVGALIYCTLLGTVVFSVPSVLSTRLSEAVANVKSYHHDDKNTAVGFRFQFHDYAKSLFLSSPAIGHGTGGFTTQFKLDNPVPAWGEKLNDPHSQYWLIASEFGLLGLAALCYFFISLLFVSFRLVEMKAVLLALLIPFFFANITDSFLTNTGIGYLFVMFCALCLGELIENNNNAQ